MFNRFKKIIKGKTFSQAVLYIHKHIWWRTVNIFYSVLANITLKLWGSKVGKKLYVGGRLRLHSGGKITIGDNVRIVSGSQNYVGGNLRTSIWTGTNADFRIGNNCAISNTTFICLGEIIILDNTYIGGGCEIYDTDFHPLNPEDRTATPDIPIGNICIGPNAFVGGFSIILKNIKIGEGAVIGAGSLVTKDVPAYEIWGGVPAKFIKELERSSTRSTISGLRE